MHWYTYLFFVLAGVAFFVGAARKAQHGNAAGMVYSIILAAFWFALALWTGGFVK